MARETYEDPGDDFDPPLDPRGRCPWPPGTEGKVAAIEARISSGWSLWHPDDATFEDVCTVEPPMGINPAERCEELVRIHKMLFGRSKPLGAQEAHGCWY